MYSITVPDNYTVLFVYRFKKEDMNNRNMEVPYDSYQNVSDDQPKDLTVKTAKKLKPIPPPLNLGQDEVMTVTTKMSTPLKEFAVIATSPKSPLMQKHLPFRKR